MKRGDVWWADLGEPRGSQPAFRRPVILVQDDLLTESRLATDMIIPMVTHLQRAVAAGNVLLQPKETGLPVASVALVCQVMTIDKTWLSAPAGTLPRRAMKLIDSGLRLALGLAR